MGWYLDVQFLRCPLGVKLRSPGGRPGSRLWPMNGHSCERPLCARGSRWLVSREEPFLIGPNGTIWPGCCNSIDALPRATIIPTPRAFRRRFRSLRIRQDLHRRRTDVGDSSCFSSPGHSLSGLRGSPASIPFPDFCSSPTSIRRALMNLGLTLRSKGSFWRPARWRGNRQNRS